MTDDSEVDAIVAELEAAGLLTIGTDADGRETWTLTREGAALARSMAMTGDEDGALELLDAMLDGRGRPRS